MTPGRYSGKISKLTLKLFSEWGHFSSKFRHSVVCGRGVCLKAKAKDAQEPVVLIIENLLFGSIVQNSPAKYWLETVLKVDIHCNQSNWSEIAFV